MTMQQVQRKILSVFLEFKRICDKHSLRYFAIGGTAIGAVRHNGFIPWDDDLDVGMPYEDYITFLKVSKEELNGNYSILGPDNCRHYLSSYVKLQDNTTTFIEDLADSYIDRYGGIYIDIFPVFGAPNNASDRNKLRKKVEKWKISNYYLRFPINDRLNKSVFHKIKWLLLAPRKLFLSFNHYTSKQNRYLSKFRFGSSDYVYFAWRPIPKSSSGTKQDYFVSKDFDALIDYPFEETTIKLMAGFDNYLKSDFGNYLELPPKEQQVPAHPKTAVNLKGSFKEYVENLKASRKI